MVVPSLRRVHGGPYFLFATKLLSDRGLLLVGGLLVMLEPSITRVKWSLLHLYLLEVFNECLLLLDLARYIRQV